LLRIVAVVARMTTELEELKRAENSASLWKLHGDALLTLLEVARALSEHAGRVMTEAGQHGNDTGEEAVKISLQKLSQRTDQVVAALTEAGSETLSV